MSELEPAHLVLERPSEGEFERVGTSRTSTVDVRVIAATNRQLEQAVADGRFREDLYYRLNVFPITLPPLRDRTGDVPLLVWYFISRHQGNLGKTITQIPQNVMDALAAYRWPGNVRELENLIERAIILSPGCTLVLEEPFATSTGTPPPASPSSQRLEDNERAHILSVLEQCAWKIKGTGNAAERLGLNPHTLHSRMVKLGIRRPVDT